MNAAALGQPAVKVGHGGAMFFGVRQRAARAGGFRRRGLDGLGPCGEALLAGRPDVRTKRSCGAASG